ncbi:AAA family ATPase [Capnocytophaga canimorsus]|uniref:AAA family ATPase n=1 Tax=Capnocytophaga canimorsus TaxID=28188 RepID=UPI0037CDFD2C
MAKIILITHQKGGVGKSTLTFNLATNIRDIAKVCIIDFDYQGSLNNVRGLSQVPIFTEEKFDEILNSNYDFIFIDTPPYLSEKLPKLCNLADVIVIPSKAGFLDILAIRSTIQIVEETGNKNKAIVVFNMVKPNTSLTSEVTEQLNDYDIRISKTMISDLVAFTRSVLVNGVEDSPNAQKQIDNLTKEILTLAVSN